MNWKSSNALIVAMAALATPSLAGDLSPEVAQAMVDDVNIGISLANDGRVPAESVDHFLPGEDIYVTMDVSDAAPGTAVSVVWIGPGGQRIAEQDQIVTEGTDSLKFVMQNTREWTQGDYRAEVWVGDEKVNDEKFRIVSARSASN